MKCIFSTSDMIACAKLVAPTIEDPKCKNLMIKSSTDIEKSVENCLNIAKENSKDEESLKNLTDSTHDVSTALDALLALLKDDEQESMNTILEEILKASDMVISSQSLQEIISQVKNLSTASSHLIQTIKKEAENQEDADFQVKYLFS
jgi:talin